MRQKLLQLLFRIRRCHLNVQILRSFEQIMSTHFRTQLRKPCVAGLRNRFGHAQTSVRMLIKDVVSYRDASNNGADTSSGKSSTHERAVDETRIVPERRNCRQDFER